MVSRLGKIIAAATFAMLVGSENVRADDLTPKPKESGAPSTTKTVGDVDKAIKDIQIEILERYTIEKASDNAFLGAIRESLNEIFPEYMNKIRALAGGDDFQVGLPENVATAVQELHKKVRESLYKDKTDKSLAGAKEKFPSAIEKFIGTDDDLAACRGTDLYNVAGTIYNDKMVAAMVNIITAQPGLKDEMATHLKSIIGEMQMKNGMRPIVGKFSDRAVKETRGGSTLGI